MSVESIRAHLRHVISISCISLPSLFVFVLIFVAGWGLSGCSRSPAAGQGVELTGGGELSKQADAQSPSQKLSRVDRQGAVEMTVTPMDIEDGSGGMIRFEVTMNTHTVDLSMDLAQLSTLATDLGMRLDAESWTGGSGHHVSGQLDFPMYAPDGTPLVGDAQEIILTIRDVDASERVFVWQVSEIP